MDQPVVATYEPPKSHLQAGVFTGDHANFSHVQTAGFVQTKDGNLQVPPISAAFGSSPSSKERISYFYNPDVADYHFGAGHPMKPPRLALTNQLVLGYGLHKKMDVYNPRRATDEEITDFHSEEYIEFLKRYVPVQHR